MFAPIPVRKPNGNSPNSIFAGFGSILDGASSIAGDFFEYRLLEKELESQKYNSAPPSTAGQAAVPNVAGNVGFNMSNDTLLKGGVVLAGVAALVIAIR